ncbi:MAG: transcription termination/antitermination protein NusA [Rickettsiaceae bacterium]|jgi:N utilization substance protein A|nr:transcription termination/antitermination protein NusA [Rickettsiaceae bacterium]
MLNIGNTELLQIADAVAREKGIAKDSIIAAMEDAIQVAGRRKYGQEHNIKAEISKKNGEVKLFRVLDIVDYVEDYFTQISLEDAKERDQEAKLGGQILDLLPPIDLGRVAAQIAKQVIMQKVRDAEREKQYNDFKGRIGEIINGTIKRVEFGDVVVEVGRAEAIIKRDQLIKNENYKINNGIRAYVQDVRHENSGAQIFLSRTDNRFLAKLFELEVPEIYDNIIEIKAIARDPGSKAKMAVFSSDMNLDAVGSCIGIRGARVRAVSNELGGEKIDVIEWSNDIAQFAINALAPATISKVVIDEIKHKVEVVLPADQLSIAIGRKGQNVRLASKLIGWGIDVMTEEQESKRRADEFSSTTELFMRNLDVEEVIAQLLTVEGFSSIEQIAGVAVDVLANIEGFDIELATELKNRAEEYINQKNENIISRLEELGVEQELIDVLADFSPEHIVILAENGIKTIEDLGELNVAEFKKLIPSLEVSDKDLKDLLAAARNYNAENK